MQKPSSRKLGADLQVGDNINVGIKQCIGKIIEFKAHPRFAEFNPGGTARVAMTDRGSITVIDDQLIAVY